MKRILLLFILLLSFVFYGHAQPLQKADAMQLVSVNSDAIGITKNQLSNLRLSAAYTDAGIHYVYLVQTVKDLPVSKQMLVLAFRNNKLISKAGKYNADFEKNVAAASPAKSAADAIRLAFLSVNIPAPAIGSGTPVDGNANRTNYGKLAGVTENVVTELLWQAVSSTTTFMQKGKTNKGTANLPSSTTGAEIHSSESSRQVDPRSASLRLVWQVQVVPEGSSDYWLIFVDAITGAIINKENATLYEKHEDEHEQGHIHEPAASNHLQRPAAVEQNNFLPPAPPSVTSGTYNVIPLYFESPSHSPFRVVTSPWLNAGAGNNATTHGWHYDGATNYDSTRGNNVSAYLDVLNNNRDGGRNRMARSTTPSPSLSFNFPHDPTQSPSTEGNRDVALTNLFYWSNIMHDVTYQYGFTEAAANFQNDNLGRGGTGGDYVRAEAQDSSGVNNANFNTPPADGGAPRMQMYLFTRAASVGNFTVNSPSSIAGDYDFVESEFSTANKLVDVGPVTAQVVYYKDANGTTYEACSSLPSNSIDGKIALIYRSAPGGCNFVSKAKQAQGAGAVAVIFVNNVPGAPIRMGGSDNTIFIPVVMVSDVDGAKIAAQLENNVNVTLSATRVPARDGDLDNGVIAHEYTHGISNRLTGGPLKTSGCLSNDEQAGEGWSDYFALMLTTDWANATVNDGSKIRGSGTYTLGEPITATGIREVPYTTDMAVNPLTYSHVQAAGGQVHRIGTLWCSAIWDMTWGIIKQENSIAPDLYKFDLANTGGNMIAFKLVHEGMRLQPCGPGFLDSRDAILQADVNLYGGRHACVIWEAFARRGMGFSAEQGFNYRIDDQVEAFDMPPPAKFNMHPADKTVCIGGTATFSITAYTATSVTYQWEKSIDGGNTWADIAGANAMSYTTPVAVAADNGSQYRIKVSSTLPCNAGMVSSNAATLSVITAPVGGTLSPASAGTCAEPATTGTLTLSGYSGAIIRWEESTNGGSSWTDIANTAVTYNYSAITTTMYRVFVQGDGCAAGGYSSTATIAASPSAPSVTIVPDPSATVCMGDPVKLTVMEGPANSISTGSVIFPEFTSLLAGVTFNFRNNNPYPVVITEISGQTLENGSMVQIYYNPAGITTRPTSISRASGWQRLFAGNVPTPGFLSDATFGKDLGLVVPANSTYGIYVEATGGNYGSNIVYLDAPNNVPVITSAGNCDIITGGDVGIGTTDFAPTSDISPNIILFPGAVKFRAASTAVTSGTFTWTPATGLNSTTTPVVAASPMTSTTYNVSHDNGSGCVRTASIAVIVKERPAIVTHPVNTSACENSDATFTVIAGGAELSYTWEQSTDNCVTYTPIAGATEATLRLSSVTRNMDGYSYRCKVEGVCTPFVYTNCATLKIDTLPVMPVITPSGVVCGGQAGTSGTQLQISNANTQSAVTTVSFSSSATVAVPDNNATGATNKITASGIPAGATVTKITVTLNMSHSYPGDMVINLKGPNLPTVTNLYKFNTGTGTGNASGVSTWGWYGAQIADGGTAFRTVAAAPYIYRNSPVWAPDGIIADIGNGIQNPAGYAATATNLRALYDADPNGEWTLAMADVGAGDVGTLSGWSLKIEYTTDANGVTSYTWAPATGLYTDNKATIAYGAGVSATSVYAAPTIATTYTVTTSFGTTGCASKTQVAVNNTPVPYITQFDSPVCLGNTVRVINRTVNAGPAVWNPATGLYMDANATIPYVAGTAKDTLWAKPMAAPATYSVSMPSQGKPASLVLNNPATSRVRTVTFNLRNNNLFPVILSEISNALFGSLTPHNVQVWYKPSAINGPVGNISTANGWTQLGTATVMPANDRTIQVLLSGLTLSIPANSTYGFAISASSQSNVPGLYVSAFENSLINTSNAVDLLTSANNTYVSPNAPLPAEPTFTGYLVGGVKVIPDPSPVCMGSKDVTLAIQGPARITTQPSSSSVCTGNSVSFTTVATGTSLMHNWRVSTNGGASWTDVVNNTLYSGAKTSTLTITMPPSTMAGYQYKDSITTPLCGTVVSNAATLLVTGLPAPQITATDQLITPGQTAILTASSTPAAAASGWTWTLNGAAISGTSNTQNVGIDQLGVYQARVTDVNGCSSLSNQLVIGAEGSDRLWIYPNPTNGAFNVRLYFDNTLPSERRVVTIYDMLGQRVASQEYTLSNLTAPYMEMTFDLSKLAAGTYLVKVTDKFSTKKASGLVVIQH